LIHFYKRKMCGGFTCSKNTLVVLNVCYILLSFIMIGVAVHGKVSGVVTSLPIVSGITFCGVFLLIISVVGFIGAIRHHQVMLFVYMCVLFLIFIIQFSVSCAALGINEKDERELLQAGWNTSDNNTKFDAEKIFNCCGLNNITEGISCEKLPCSQGTSTCDPCMAKITEKIDTAFDAAGVVGLLFSFTEFIGIWLAARFRNHKDPRANPSAFL